MDEYNKITRVEEAEIVPESGIMEPKKHNWYIDLEKILTFFAILICGYAAAIMKNGEEFVEFTSRQPALNDFLHEYIFHNFLELVTVHTSKVAADLLVVAIVLWIVSFIMDFKQSGPGYALRITGMLTASLTGLMFLLVHVSFGYGQPVMNAKAYIFLALVLAGIVITVCNFIFYKKRKGDLVEIKIATKVTLGLCVAACFIGSGIYLAINLGTEYKVCYEANQYIKEHPEEINSDIAYQIGNVVKGKATYQDGVMYYTLGRTIYRTDASGAVEKLYTLPEGATFPAYGIYYHNDYLYVGCKGFSGEAQCSILQVSVADGTVKEICSPSTNRIYFGLADGKLLYAVSVEKYICDIYCIDLDKTTDETNATVYDKEIDNLTTLDREMWIQKYLYGYLDVIYWPNDKYQFIDENGYYIYDLNTSDPDYYGDPNKYSYNANCTLVFDEAYGGSEYLLEEVVDFNIFNDSIYYMQETQNGYDIYSCDKVGENQTYIASIPVAFEDSDYGYSAILLVGEGFMVCMIDSRNLEYTYVYFINMNDGTVKEIP